MTLTLLDEVSGQEFAFAGVEQPEHMNPSVEQRLAVHDLVGGARTIDAMGASLGNLTWTGLFVDGSNATDKAGYLDNLAKTGASQIVSWDAYRFRGVVRSFTADFQSFWRVGYQIVFTPSEDLATPITSTAGLDINATMSADLASANTYAGAVNDTTLTGQMSALSTAIGNVSTLAHAAPSLIASIVQPVQAALNRVQTLITTLGGGLDTLTTFGGLSTGYAGGAAALTNLSTLSTQVTALYSLRNVLGRMSQNVLASAQAAGSLVIAGGNLMQIAANQYGDPMAWTGIANANGLSDPTLTGVNTLVIPVSPDTTNGVLNQ